jgi:hypothetical protein
MRRALLLLPLAALGAGCQASSPCDAPFLNVYWTPGHVPNGGFQVPGLIAAGLPNQLDCAVAGVDGVQVRIGGVVVPCSGGLCLDPDTWLCSTRGVSVPISAGGTYDVRIDALDANGNLKYTSGIVVAEATKCGGSAVGVFSQGIAGTLGIDYTFTDTATCQPGSNIVWDLRTGLSTPFDTGSIACGTTNPFLVNGGLAVPAGVYTLDSITEVSGTSVSHALCLSTFVHAGAETLPVELPVPTATCP